MVKTLFPLLQPFTPSTTPSTSAYRSLQSHLTLIGLALLVYIVVSQIILKYVPLPTGAVSVFAGNTSVLVNRLGYLFASPRPGQTLVLKGPDGHWQIGQVIKTGLVDQDQKYTVLDSQGRFRLIANADLVGKVVYPKIPRLPAVNQTVLGQSVSPSPSPSVNPVPTLVSSPTPSPQVFFIEIRPKASFTQPTLTLAAYLAEYLDPGGLGRITFLGPFYDVNIGDPLQNQGSNIYNFDYYIVLTKGMLTPTDLHTSIVDITIRYAPASLKPYLLNNRFCRTDGDCQVRQSHCLKGAFNRYDRLIDAYACPQYNQTQDGTPFGVMDQNFNCITDIQFGSVVCQANVCQTQSQEIICQP